MASNTNPRQLKMSCTVSAIYLPEIGSLAGATSRFNSKKDPSNTLSATALEVIDRSIYSPELGNLTSGAGGFLPKLNLEIGAPAATFLEGQIINGETHPTLTLIKGAEQSKNVPSITYRVPANATRANARAATPTTANGGSASPPLPSVKPPFIPVIKDGEFANLDPKITYNIWEQNLTPAQRQNANFLLNFGITNYKAVGAVNTTATIQANGSKINVNALNASCILTRIFPIADDLLYENDVKIHYPEVNSIKKSPELVQAKGGPNCGFWLHFDITPASLNPDNNKSPQLMIYWGAPKSNELDRYFTEFVLVLALDKNPVLRYKTPNASTNTIQSIQDKWGKIELRGETLSKSTRSLDIFVHYAGPNMYIGMTPDVSEWNSIEPIKVSQLTDEDSSDDNYWKFFQQKESIIEIYFEHLNASFTYSPICFNNFNSSELKEATSDTRNKIKVNFDVSKKEYDRGTYSETKVTEDFIKNRRPNETSDLPGAEPVSPTYYGDWRRKKETDEIYKVDPELVYKELSHTNDSSLDENPRTYIQSKIYYNTTVEGPIFLYLKAIPDAEQRSKILRPIWKNLSDVTSYLQAATVNISYNENKTNKSYKTSKAILQFANLTNDIIGMQILNALQENVLVFTLKAGYDNLYTYFQGVSRDISVSRQPDSFNVTVTCEDLGDVLLSDIRYNTTSSMPFDLESFKKIFEESFYIAGLSKLYKPREAKKTSSDFLHKVFFTKQIGLLGLTVSNALTRSFLNVNKKVKIKQVILSLLRLGIYMPGDDITKVSEGLPILYWDPEKENYILTTRADEPRDELFFAGDTSQLSPGGSVYLANSNPDREHGIVTSSGWQETTSLRNLHTAVLFFANLANNQVLFLKSDPSVISKGLSSASLNELDKFVKNPATDSDIGNFQSQPVIGYVGYHKEFLFDDESTKLILNEAFAREQFKIREKFIRETFTLINLNVLVTKPLSSNGTFKIKSFNGGFESSTSDYVYDNVDYTFDINTNLITAKITGVKFPEFS